MRRFAYTLAPSKLSASQVKCLPKAEYFHIDPDSKIPSLLPVKGVLLSELLFSKYPPLSLEKGT